MHTPSAITGLGARILLGKYGRHVPAHLTPARLGLLCVAVVTGLAAAALFAVALRFFIRLTFAEAATVGYGLAWFLTCVHLLGRSGTDRSR